MINRGMNIFGPQRFQKWSRSAGKAPHYSGCRTYELGWGFRSGLQHLLDHGFLADCASVWCKDLKGSEIAIISRTYCENDEIDNPPAGLRCVRLPQAVMGPNDIGTPIATAIVSNTTAAEEVLQACTSLPADLFAFALSRNMMRNGLGIALHVTDNMNPLPLVQIVGPAQQA